MTRARDASSAVAAEVLAERGIAGRRVLLAGGADALADEARDAGATVTLWHRTARGGRAATAWPEPGPYDDVVLRLPQGKEALRTLLSALSAQLSPGGRLWLHGANDEGVRSADAALAERFTSVSTASSKKHCRVWAAEGLIPATPVAAERFQATVAGVSLDWVSWPGLFAHGRVDPATQALMEAFPAKPEGRVLDFGCGAGLLSQFLQRRDGVTCDMSDIDALAVDTARENVPGAEVMLADGLPPQTGRYRFIISNPPLHFGKDLEPGLLRQLVADAPKRLGRSGELWITTQGAVPLRALLSESFSNVQQVRRDQRFAVWRAVK